MNTQRVEGHTPIPWAIKFGGEFIVPASSVNLSIGGAEDAKQDIDNFAEQVCRLTNDRHGRHTAKANAAFIVHACNNIERLEKVNEALVRALERLVEMREIHERIYGMEKQHYIISDNEDWAAGRAALALAKEPA